ncbi:Radical SAM domain protein [hydrothermal vent metagenome]|uniref:Radical SAM domain protein n=1 Tax=hydrothermal vent metagenome TaxID=652676 RepID=A0A3B1C3X2_9ZZZZ
MSGGQKILLCSMPDVAMAFKRVGDMPNLGLASLAAMVPEADVRIIDLHLIFHKVGARLARELKEFGPEVVGFTSMSFQFKSALALAEIVRRHDPLIPIILGGYHASMAYEEFGQAEIENFDYLVRGEGERAFRALTQKLKNGETDFSSIPSLSHKVDGGWIHNPLGELENLSEIPFPRREARRVGGFTLFGRKIETIETSRGCTLPCNFCSISKMYGHTFRTYPIERVIEEIKRCRKLGAEMIFFVDDNITLDIPRFKLLCREVVRQNLNDMEFITQVSVTGMAKDPELARLMRNAGFNIVFMGIENVSPKQLKKMNKGDIRNATTRAISHCRENDIVIVGGFITGLPDDEPADVKHLFKVARKLGVDHIIVQCVTPYPNTDLRKSLLADGLVANEHDYSLYNGYVCNVRTHKMDTKSFNRLLNWEYIKLYFDPRYIRANRMLQRKDASKWVRRVFINSLEHFPAYFTNRLFVSRHTL